ncbi:hypothetical protein L1987_02185 [Smallanthus sonchifolius]|uniref:Uncharacterized protein n=1 Tax=Smallanthus sonchifolius TaxID=185202 RepID=A0ACB9K773_9ASTR|nr:hypothetical protein L1987_02185 [Smallanthus sonchifolius]
MVKRPPLKPHVFLSSSFCGFNAAWPANADCWIAEVAISVRRFKGMLKRWWFVDGLHCLIGLLNLVSDLRCEMEFSFCHVDPRSLAVSGIK